MYRQGQTAVTHCYLILSGSIDIYRKINHELAPQLERGTHGYLLGRVHFSHDSAPETLMFLGQELKLFHRPSSFTFVTASDCLCLKISL